MYMYSPHEEQQVWFTKVGVLQHIEARGFLVRISIGM